MGSINIAKILTTKGCENNKPLREKQKEGSTKFMKIAKLSKAICYFYFLVYRNWLHFWTQVLIYCMKLDATLLCRRHQSHHTDNYCFYKWSFLPLCRCCDGLHIMILMFTYYDINYIPSIPCYTYNIKH